MRWNRPEAGLVSPAQFIHVAEESGSIHELGRWILRVASAASMARGWDDARRARGGEHLDPAVQAARRRRDAGRGGDRLGARPRARSRSRSPRACWSTTPAPCRRCARSRTPASRSSSTTSAPATRRSPTSRRCRSTRSRSTARSSAPSPPTRATPPSSPRSSAWPAASTWTSWPKASSALAQKQKLLELGCPVMQGYLFGRPVPVEQITC